MEKEFKLELFGQTVLSSSIINIFYINKNLEITQIYKYEKFWKKCVHPLCHCRQLQIEKVHEFSETALMHSHMDLIKI